MSSQDDKCFCSNEELPVVVIEMLTCLPVMVLGRPSTFKPLIKHLFFAIVKNIYFKISLCQKLENNTASVYIPSNTQTPYHILLRLKLKLSKQIALLLTYPLYLTYCSLFFTSALLRLLLTIFLIFRGSFNFAKSKN